MQHTNPVLRVGLLGVGGVAAKYASLYGEYPRSRLAVAYDAVPSAGLELAERFGCKLAASAEEVIASDVDAIVISTPNHLHLPQAAAALRAGKHVLLQKPMTVNLTEAEDLVAIAAASGRKLAIYMNSLDNAVMRDMKRMIEEGALGRIGAINCKLANGMGHVWREQPQNFWRGSRKLVGGGSFAMLASHYINLSQWLLDRPITKVAALGKNLMCDHIEGDDIMAAIVEFETGEMGVIESSWCVKGEQMSIHGSVGSVAYLDSSVITLKSERPFSGEVIRYDTPGIRIVAEQAVPPAMGDWRNPHNQHRCFVDAILDGTPVPMPAIRGLQDMRVLDAAYRASERRSQIAIDRAW